jgi:hypothetical protein
MAKIEAELILPPQLTVQAIYDWYAVNQETWDSLGINVGDVGEECDRKLFYNLHWVTPPEVKQGRMLRLLETGNLEEPRFEQNLVAVGVDFYGAQDKIRLVAGHVRGKRDGAGIGFLEALKTEHLCEFKTSKAADWRAIVKHGVLKAKPTHYGQCQLGMHAFGLTRCFYLVKNKDTEELHSERIEYDAEYCLKMLAKCERIIRATSPPAKISEDPEAFACKFCKHKPVCHHEQMPRVNCRTCLHSTAEMSGDAHWSCARWNKPLSFDEQKEGCPAHLFDPDLVPGEQIDSDEVNETVTYRLSDGSIWVDGQVTEEKAA